MQRHQLVMQLERGGVIALLPCRVEFRAQPRRDVGRDRDAAMAAMRHVAEDGCILARQLIEVLAHRRALLRHPHHAGGRILHAGDVLQFEQPRHGVDRHVDHRTAGDVVDDDRNPDRVVDRLEVLVHAFLGRLVVIGRHHQHGIRACLLRVLGELDGLLGRIGASTRDDRRAALGLVDAPFDDALVLVMAQGGAFAGRADGHQAVGAFGDLPAYQATEGGLVERAVPEWRDQGGERPPELCLGCHGLPPNA